MKVPVKVLYASWLPSVKDRDKLLKARSGTNVPPVRNLLSSVPDEYLDNLDQVGRGAQNGTPFPNYTPQYNNGDFNNYFNSQMGQRNPQPYEGPYQPYNPGNPNNQQVNTNNYQPNPSYPAPSSVSSRQSLTLTAPDPTPKPVYEGQVGKAITTGAAVFDAFLPYGKINRWPRVTPNISPNEHPYGTGSQALYEQGGRLDGVNFFEDIIDSPRARLDNGGILLLDDIMDSDRARLAYGGTLREAKSGIHIKPENRGKFNATKKATGKSTEELTHSSNPVTKKRAIFAQNAAKWHHEDGGQIDYPDINDPRRTTAYNPNQADHDLAFQAWYSKNTMEGKRGMPYSDKGDYDYYSFYKNGGARSNSEGHFPDTFKRPNHKTFSVESIYSTPEHKGGSWKDEKFIPQAKSGHWIQGAVNPAHKGYCTPMTKSTCTPRRKAFAKTMKKHHGFHEDGGLIELSGGGSLSSAKAAEILHDGTAHGHPLTPKQRRFMGWKAGQKAPEGTNLPYTPQSRTDAYLVDDINQTLTTGLRTRNTGYAPDQQQLLTDAYIWKQKNPNINPQNSIQGYFGQQVDPNNPLSAHRGRLSKIGGDALSMYNSTPNQDVRTALPTLQNNLRSLASMKSGGHMMDSSLYNNGGVMTHWGGSAIPMAHNPYDGGTIKFNGNSHADGGIGMSANGKTVEVQGGETASRTMASGGNMGGDLTIYGDMRIPGTNTKFQTAVKEIGEQEVAMDKLKTKGTSTVNELDPINKYEQIKFNAAELMMKGGDMGQKQLAKNKQNLSDLQQAMHETAKHLNLDPEAMSKGEIKTAKKGMKIKGYPDGGRVRNPLFPQGDFGPYAGSTRSIPTASTWGQGAVSNYGDENPFNKEEFAYDDETGTVADRHNNPGNIKFDVDPKTGKLSDYAKILRDKYGAVPGERASDGSRFARFPNRDAGDLARRNLLFTGDKYKNMTVKAGISRWTNGEPYDLSSLGDVANKKLGKLTPQEQDQLLALQTQKEGSKYAKPWSYKSSGPRPEPITPDAGGGLGEFTNNFKLGQFTPNNPWTPSNRQFDQPEVQGKPVQYIPPDDRLEYLGPQRPIPTQAKPLDFNDVSSDIFAIATNHERPVYAQRDTPQLYQPYKVSFQDRLNENQAGFNNIQRLVGGSNPTALGALAAQKYGADSSVLADQFRFNQGISADVYNKNIDLTNQSNRFNLGIAANQADKQETANAKTREMNQLIANSLSTKYSQVKARNNELMAYENLYNFRLFPNEAGGLSEYNYNAPIRPDYSGRGNIGGGQDNGNDVRLITNYNADKTVRNYRTVDDSPSNDEYQRLQIERARRNLPLLSVPSLNGRRRGYKTGGKLKTDTVRKDFAAGYFK